MRWLKRILVLLVLLFIGGEIVLRIRGFTQFPLFVPDARYEYMQAPDQDTYFGKIHFTTNELGMRCGPIGPKKKRRVLVAGDSVINGGNQTTQDSLATGILNAADGVEVLNCSAPSWGPDNIAAFLTAHGTFDSDRIIIYLSSHDAFDRMTFEPLVGRHPNYPDHRPWLAWSMYLDKKKYAWGAYPAISKGKVFNEGWAQLRDLSRRAGIPLVVVLHPEVGEVEMKHYDPRGRQLLDSLATWNLPVLRALPFMTKDLYTDNIHVNDRGQRRIAQVLAPLLGQ
jgi:hypothetical protein